MKIPLRDLINARQFRAWAMAAQKQAKDSAQTNEQIIASANEGIIVFGKDLRYQVWNPFMEKLSGRKAADVLGRHPLEVFPFLRDVGLVERLERALAGETSGPLEFPLEVNGRLTWNIDNTAPLRDSRGDIVGVISTVQDITTRRLSEVALQDSEKRHRSLLSSLAEGIVLQDASGAIIDCNARAESILGLTMAQMTGRTSVDSRWRAIHEDGTPFAGETHPSMRALRTGQSVRDAIMGVHLPDGTLRWISINAEPVLAPGETRPSGVVTSFTDFTERKAARERLRKSEESFRLALENSPIVVFNHDRELRYTWIYNPHPGFDPQTVIGKTDADLLPESDAARLMEIKRGVLATGQKARAEVRTTITGRPLFYDLSVEPLRNAAGEIVGLSGASIEISQRKRTETLLSTRAELAEIATRDRLDELLQSALDKAELLTGGCIGFFHYVDANQETLSLQTWSTNTLKKMCTAEGAGQHYPVSKAGVWVDCLRSRKPVIHNDYPSLPHKKGLPAGHAPVLREAVVPIIRNGVVVCIMGVGNKPTEYTEDDVQVVAHIASIVADQAIRLRAETTLRESEQRFRTLVQASSDVIYRMNADWTELRHLVGRGFVSDTLEPCRDWQQKYLHADDAGSVMEAVQKAIRAKGVFELRHRIRRLDGSFGWTASRAIPLTDAQGAITEWFGMASDVTREVQLEAQLRQAQKMEAIGTLASGIAHDLNNLLAPMLMVSGLIKDKLTTEEDLKMLSMLEQEARRGGEIVKQLLIFSRGLEGEPALVQPRAALEEIIQLMRETLPRAIDIRQKCSPDVRPIVADQTQFHQLLLNLCVNARDAMPDGGTLTVSASNVELKTGETSMPPTARAGSYVLIEVKDTGPGIPHDIRDRIFEPFFTTKPIGKGTGLGLSTVHGIAHKNGGFVTVDSEPGQGASFKVYWPAAATPASGRSSAVAGSSLPRGEGQLILVVDDERNIREATRIMLERQGYRVQLAADGKDALTQFCRSRGGIGLVLTDIMMPGMNGIALATALRALDPHLPIIMTSGMGDIDRRAELDALGITDVLMKPCPVSVMLEAVQRQVKRPNGPGGQPAAGRS